MATIPTNTAKHKKDVARLKLKHKRDIAKTKMKERSKRWFASIPIVGTALLFWSGKDEYDDHEAWKKDNPNGSTGEYVEYKVELLAEP